MPKITNIEHPFCPTCRRKLDGATTLAGEETPKVGDMSFCIYCLEILQFQEDGDGLKYGIFPAKQVLEQKIPDVMAVWARYQSVKSFVKKKRRNKD